MLDLFEGGFNLCRKSTQNMVASGTRTGLPSVETFQ